MFILLSRPSRVSRFNWSESLVGFQYLTVSSWTDLCLNEEINKNIHCVCVVLWHRVRVFHVVDLSKAWERVSYRWWRLCHGTIHQEIMCAVWPWASPSSTGHRMLHDKEAKDGITVGHFELISSFRLRSTVSSLVCGLFFSRLSLFACSLLSVQFIFIQWELIQPYSVLMMLSPLRYKPSYSTTSVWLMTQKKSLWFLILLLRVGLARNEASVMQRRSEGFGKFTKLLFKLYKPSFIFSPPSASHSSLLSSPPCCSAV